jgi:hypothetical protein
VKFWRTAAIIAFLLACPACAKEPAQRAAAPFAFNERIGWFHGSCLAITAPALASGTPVTLVVAAEPQTLQTARIQQKTDSSAACPALLEDRAKVNQKPDTTFYALEADGVGKSDMGFGIVSPVRPPAVVNGLAQVDLDQDGKSEIFSTCTTTEGIRFSVWTEKAYQGDPRWSAYYYLAYDLTPTCP